MSDERQNIEGHSHEMGMAEKVMIKELRRYFGKMADDFKMDPMTAIAVVGQTFGEYAALMDYLLKTKPEKFDVFYDMEKLGPRLNGDDMFRTLVLNTKHAYNAFKPREKVKRTHGFTDEERRQIVEAGGGGLLALLDMINTPADGASDGHKSQPVSEGATKAGDRSADSSHAEPSVRGFSRE